MKESTKKAKELIEKFSNKIPFYSKNDNLKKAKECAIICVDEILEIKSVDKDLDLSDFWQEVRQEIINYK